VYCWRITKYNPKYRDESGAYKKDEWTSVYDMGKEFNGREFTLDSYIESENSYVQAITIIMNGNNINFLVIDGLEKNGYSNDIATSGIDIDEYIKSIKNDMTVHVKGIDLFARIVLREMIWCKLINDSKMFVHFGYDYYMYIGSCEKLEIEINLIRNIGLFVEEMDSPYMQ
jgi:hypothetical protein